MTISKIWVFSLSFRTCGLFMMSQKAFVLIVDKNVIKMYTFPFNSRIGKHRVQGLKKKIFQHNTYCILHMRPIFSLSMPALYVS